MSNLTLRIITALVLAGVTLISLFVLPDGAAMWLLTGFLVVALWEWGGLAFTQQILGRCAYVLLLLLAAAYLFIDLASSGDPQPIFVLASGWWLLAAFWLVFLGGRSNRIWCALAGVMIILPAFVAAQELLSDARGELAFVWVLCLVAATDIGAYFTGKSLGRHKLAPDISRGKTWEGLAGGIIAAVLVGVAGAVQMDKSMLWWGCAALLIALYSAVGDLAVSAFKRHAGLKDSGSILPGHGGILDRIDGLVAALPLFLLVWSWTEG